MPKVNAFQTNFSAGELSPRLYGRVDVAKWSNACYTMNNFVAQRFGGARKRGGSQYIASVKTSSSPVRLIPFIFSVTQAYILEFGDTYIRIYTNGGQVVDGSPVEVSTPWDEDEVWELQFVQSADVLYIVHPDYAPRQFERTSATTFTLTAVDFEDGPFLELNTTSTTLTPAATANLSAIAGTPTSTVSAEAGSSVAGMFDNDPASYLSVASRTVTVTYSFTAGTYVCDGYYLMATVNGNMAPSSWRFEGYNGSSWVTLDTRVGQTGWSGGETRYYSFINATAYEAYRIVVLGQNDTTANFTQIAELGMHQSVATQTAFNLTASAVTGINDGSGFQTTDVGRPIRLLGSDGRWRWVEIIARTSTTVVTIKVYEQALFDTKPIVNWRLGAWSDETGWPGSISFYNGRLCFARSATQPQTVWTSVVDDFTSFRVSDPIQDDDAITATIASDTLNEIKWIAEGTELFVGATAAIRTIGPTSAAAAFSPTNIQQKRQTNYGASYVPPVRVGNTAIYAGYYRTDIREIAYSFDVDGYVSQDMSILSEHLCLDRVKQMAYSQNPDSIVWFVTDNNDLRGMTYERDQEVVAFHRHGLGGTDVEVESVATIPGSFGDELWLSVARTVNGGTVRYIERIYNFLPDTVGISQRSYLDSFLQYTGSSATTITGLSHLEGETVYAWGAQGQQGPYTVSSGQITLGTAVTSCFVGLLYSAEIETLPPEAGAAGGTAQTQIGRISEVFLRVDRSMGGSVGPHDGTLETIDYTKSVDHEGAYGVSGAAYTGDVRVPIDMEWNRGRRIKIRQSSAGPFHVLGLISEIRVSG